MQNSKHAPEKQNEEQAAIIARLTAHIESLEAKNKELAAHNHILDQKIKFLLARLFGHKSEKLDPNQLQLLIGLGDPETPEIDDDPSPERERTKNRPSRQHKPRMPEHLPVEEVHLDPEEVRQAPQDYKRIDEEVTEELDVIPAKYFKRRIVRGKYVRLDDKEAAPLIAPLPERLIPGGYATPGLLTDILIKKYQDHLPLYRQEQILKNRYGIDLSRQVMADWVEKAADWLGAIYRGIRGHLQSGAYFQIDETPATYCNKDGPPGSAKGYFWVYHNPQTHEVLYEWHTSRAGQCLEETLRTFKGTVQCDGYGAYASYAKDRNDIDMAGCWSHARRKFYESREEAPAVAGWFLKHIQALYAVETDLRKAKADPETRRQTRERDSRWRLNLIGKALKAKMATYLPKSGMGKAIHYALRQWEELNKYCGNGLLEIDNNGVENAIRPTALGKKNWLFIGHPDAGQRSAVIYTIIENCRKIGVDPHEYLLDVLTRLPSMKITEIDQLLPANWLAAKKARAA